MGYKVEIDSGVLAKPLELFREVVNGQERFFVEIPAKARRDMQQAIADVIKVNTTLAYEKIEETDNNTIKIYFASEVAAV